MASKTLASASLLICINLVFFTLVSSHYVPCPCHGGNPKSPPTPSIPTPSVPTPSTPTPSVPTPSTPSPSTPKPSQGKCPINTLKLAACANVLGGLLSTIVGTASKTPCCSLIQGLADLDAAVCLCTAIKADILGIHLNVPLSLSVLLNYCGKGVPSGFQCS